MRSISILGLGLLFVCAGCSEPLQEPLSPQFGRAIASMDSEISPADPSSAPPPGSGAVGAAAVERYQTGHVIGPSSTGSSGAPAPPAPSSNPASNTSGPNP